MDREVVDILRGGSLASLKCGNLDIRLCSGFGVLGNLAHGFVPFELDVGAADVFHRDVQGAQDQGRALEVDGVAHERIHDFHERGLNRGFILDHRDGVQACLRWRANSAIHALVEVAELLSAERWGAAPDSGDFDMSASASAL